MTDNSWRDKDTLEELYVEEEMTQPEIAEELGCSTQTVYTWMKKHGIETRDNGEAQRVKHRRKPVPLKQENGYMRWTDSYKKREGRDRVLVHRLLYVAHYGVESVKNMEIHHRNGIKWDNRIENLEAMTKSEHAKLHSRQRAERAKA